MNVNRKYSIIAVLIFTILLCVVRGNDIYNISREDVNNTNFKRKAESKYKMSQQLNTTQTLPHLKFKRGAEELLTSIKIDTKVDVNLLVDTILKESHNIIKIVFDPNKVTYKKPAEGGEWYSIMANRHVVSAYYHPTIRHYARAIGETDPGRSYGDPDEWAIAVVPKSMSGGNKSYYDVCDRCNCKPPSTAAIASTDICTNYIDDTENNSHEINDNDNLNTNTDPENGKPNDKDSGANNLKQFSLFSMFMIFTSIFIWQTHIIF